MNTRIQLVAALLFLAGSNVLFGQSLSERPSELPANRPISDGMSRMVRVESAKVVCIHNINVAAQADGLIEQLMVDEGSTVNKGDTLLMIDSRVAKAELEVANKEFEAAQMQAKQTAEIEYAKAASEVSREEYDAEYKLWEQGATTWSVLKRKRLEAQRAILGVDVAEVKHEQEQLAADVAQEKRNAADVQLGLYKVVAPYDGIIVERKRDLGEWIRGGEPVLRLVSLGEMKVEALVPVDGISVSALEGADVTIRFPMNQRIGSIQAKIDFVSPEIESRRVRVSTRINNQQIDGKWLLRDGMQANLEIQLSPIAE